MSLRIQSLFRLLQQCNDKIFRTDAAPEPWVVRSAAGPEKKKEWLLENPVEGGYFHW